MDSTDRQLLEEQDRGEIDRLQRRVDELENAVEAHLSEWKSLATTLGLPPEALAHEVRFQAEERIHRLRAEVDRMVASSVVAHRDEIIDPETGPRGSMIGTLDNGDMVVFVPHEAEVLQQEIFEAVTDAFEARRCEVCGCTDLRACDGGCEWWDANLCSECVADIDVGGDNPQAEG